MNTATETASRIASATVTLPNAGTPCGTRPGVLTTSMRLAARSKRLPAGRMGRVSEAAGDVQAAGHFRIYLGAAAGVGKTFAMLNEGRRRRDRGTDVVIGFVECHGRARTEEMIADLEVVPRKQVEYRGSALDEMDLDAVLARHPRVAL